MQASALSKKHMFNKTKGTLVTERGPAGRKYNFLSRVIDKKKFYLKSILNSMFILFFTFQTITNT